MALSRTITLHGWTFHMDERADELFLSVPDRGGVLDSFPQLPDQLTWAEREFEAFPKLEQVWPTVWKVPPETLPAINAFFTRLGATG